MRLPPLLLCVLFVAACGDNAKKSPDVVHPTIALAATPCGNQVLHPPEFRDEPFAQRACCPSDGKPACDPGLAQGKSPHIDAHGTTCDAHPDEVAKWKAKGTYEQCRCGNSPLYSSGSCIRAGMYDTRSCKVDNTPTTPVAMSLFVAGMNHGRLDAGAYVNQQGVNELAQTIFDAKVDPTQVVVAMSGSMETSCTAGDYQGDGGSQNGECLAYALRERFHRNFVYTGWHMSTDPLKHGGLAIITGERWVVDQREDYVTPAPNGYGSLVVYLRDTKDPKGARQPMYVLHMGGPLPEKLRTFVEHARQQIQGRPNDMAPLFVGDMNVRPVGDEMNWCDTQLRWLNRGLRCGSAEFNLEGEIVHAFAGKPEATDPQLKFPINIRWLQPVALKYSAEPPGTPASRVSGIWLPNIAHNVVALDLTYVNPPTLPTCAALGGIARPGLQCPPSETIKGLASDTKACCMPICDPVTQPKPRFDIENGVCTPSCTEKGGDHCAGGASCGPNATNLGSAYGCAICCKTKPPPPPLTCPEKCKKARQACGGTDKTCGTKYQDCLKECELP